MTKGLFGDDGFDDWWALLRCGPVPNPRMSKKIACREIWEKRGLAKQTDLIMKQTQLLKDSYEWQREDGKAQPAPKTLLNGQFWLDDAPINPKPTNLVTGADRFGEGNMPSATRSKEMQADHVEHWAPLGGCPQRCGLCREHRARVQDD